MALIQSGMFNETLASPFRENATREIYQLACSLAEVFTTFHGFGKELKPDPTPGPLTDLAAEFKHRIEEREKAEREGKK